MKQSPKRKKAALPSKSKAKAAVKASAVKKTAVLKASAKAGRLSRKSPLLVKGSVKGSKVRSNKPKSESARDVLASITSTIDAVPPQVRDAAWSVLEDWMKPNADTDQAESAATGDSWVGDGLSICFFSPSLDEAQIFCDRLLGQNFAWADKRATRGTQIVSVNRLRTEYAFTHRGETEVDKVIADSDLIVFAVDGGSESLGRATVLSFQKVLKISRRADVPMLVIIGKSEAILTNTQDYRESGEVRARWRDRMRKRKTEIVDALGCPREDAVVVSLPLKQGMTTAAERMLTKLPDSKRLLLLSAMSEELVPKQFRKATPNFYETIWNLKRTVYQGADQSFRYLLYNPVVRGTLWKLASGKPLTEADYEVLWDELQKAVKNGLHLKPVRARINEILRTCDLAEI
jgi:hypothetical protein